MSGTHGDVRYEKADVQAASVLRAGAIVFGLSTLTALLLIAFITALVRREERRAAPARALAFESGRQAPQPRLQEQPFADVRALRAEEERVLHGYAWADQPAGVVRIPIDQAMRLYAERAAKQENPSPDPAVRSTGSGSTGGPW